LDAFAAREPCNGPEHGDPVVATSIDLAALRPCRDPGDREALVVALDAAADRAEGIDNGVDAVGLLVAQLPRAVHPALAARLRGEEREERQLVDEERHLAGVDRGR